jgi:hypothetical protein
VVSHDKPADPELYLILYPLLAARQHTNQLLSHAKKIIIKTTFSVL